MSPSSDDIIPGTSRQSLPHKEEIRKWAEAAKQIFEEEQDPSQASSPGLKMEGLRLSSLESQVPKCCIKQGPIKSCKKLKFTSSNDDEYVTWVASLIHFSQLLTQECSHTLHCHYAIIILVPVLVCKLLSQ